MLLDDVGEAASSTLVRQYFRTVPFSAWTPFSVFCIWYWLSARLKSGWTLVTSATRDLFGHVRQWSGKASWLTLADSLPNNYFVL